MKTLLFCFVALVLFTGKLKAQDTHIGLWKGEDKKELGYLHLGEDGYAFLVIEGDTMGGKESMLEGTKIKMTYTIDYATTPKSIDFIISSFDSGAELGRLMGIIEFNTDKQMTLRVTFGGTERPKNFLPKGNTDTVVLNKVASK